MVDVVTLGETMVVFDSVTPGPLRYAHQYTSHTGGAETNVATGVVRQGHTAGWISRVGDDEFGRLIVNTFRGEGVDTSRVAFDAGHSTGIFFREAMGNGEYRNTYYRKNSAFSAFTPDLLDESYIQSARYFMVSGITLAVSPAVAATACRAIEAAKEKGVKVCFDPNLRLKMWTIDEARAAMEKIWPMVDIVLPGREEGQLLFGTDQPDEIVRIFQERYRIPTVIIKDGAKGAIGYEEGRKVVSPGFPVKRVVDAFGAGDAFCAGILSGYLEGLPLEQTLRRANAIGALVVSAPGNIEAIPDAGQVEAFLRGQVEIGR